MGVNQISMVLSYLTVVKKTGKIKTINELILDTTNQLEKMLSWLNREDDGTISQKEIKYAKRMGKDILKYGKSSC